jgi:hypothetical protein
MIAQSDIKLHNALERLNLVLIILSKALCNFMPLWAIMFRSFSFIVLSQALCNFRSFWSFTLFRKDLNRIAQNDLKLHNALERLNLVLFIYIKFNLSKALCNFMSLWAILFRSFLNNVND